MTDDKESLYAEAILGRDAEEWWQSELGKYIIARSKAETDAIISKMKTCTADEVLLLQERWVIAEQALVWLNDAIVAGNQALMQLDNLNDR